MNSITTDQLFPSLSANGPDKNPTDNYDPTLKIFEEMVDHIVAKSLKDSKAEAQAAVEKAKAQAEQQRKLAFLMGAVHEAEVALEGLNPSPSRPLNSSDTQAPPPPISDRAFKESQLVYWKAQLAQAGMPDGMGGLL